MFYSLCSVIDILMKQIDSKVKMLKTARETSKSRKNTLKAVSCNKHGNTNTNANSSSTKSRRCQAVRNCVEIQQQNTNNNVQVDINYIRKEIQHNQQIHDAIANDLRPEFQQEQRQAALEWQNDEARQLREAFLQITSYFSQNDHLAFRKAVCLS